MKSTISKTVRAGVLAVGATCALLGSTAVPATAAEFVSAGVHFGIGTGYAPGYHWYRWHDVDGWHRRWAPYSWVAPVAYRPQPVLYGPPAYRYRHRDRDWHRDDGWHRDRDWHRDGDGRRDHDWHRDHDRR